MNIFSLITQVACKNESFNFLRSKYNFIWEACQIKSELSEVKIEKKIRNTGTVICVTVIFEIYLQGGL